MGVIAGLQARPGRVMGHAGAWVGPGEPDAEDKEKALTRAGVTIVDHPEKLGEGMKTLLSNRATGHSNMVSLRSCNSVIIFSCVYSSLQTLGTRKEASTLCDECLLLQTAKLRRQFRPGHFISNDLRLSTC